MRWPWGTALTEKQAEETAKYLLSLSHATVLGAVGSFFILALDVFIRLLLFITGIFLALFLYLFAMKLLKEVKRYGYRE